MISMRGLGFEPRGGAFTYTSLWWQNPPLPPLGFPTRLTYFVNHSFRLKYFSLQSLFNQKSRLSITVVIFFSVWDQAGFFKSCSLSGSGSGRNFPILPAHDTIPPALESMKNLKWDHFTPAKWNVGFLFLEWNFSLTNRCKVKGKISNGIKGLVIVQQRGVFLRFCWQNNDWTRHNCKLVFWPPFFGWNLFS